MILHSYVLSLAIVGRTSICVVTALALNTRENATFASFGLAFRLATQYIKHVYLRTEDKLLCKQYAVASGIVLVWHDLQSRQIHQNIALAPVVL